MENLTTRQLLELFATLPAPTLEEMHGEFDATLLAAPTRTARLLAHSAVNNPAMKWRCKAFRPIDRETGRGYNGFAVLGRNVQRFAMATRIAPSQFDGRPAYQLDYRAFRSLCGDLHMLDDVRRVSEGTYLGIGTCGVTATQREVPLPFLLRGPARPYRGDIGTRRSSNG